MASITRNGKTVEYGTAKFEGAIFSLWYGFAQQTKPRVIYREGDNHFLRIKARADARRLANEILDGKHH